jgi:cell division protein FtsW (lipid II flippase)
MREYFVEFSKYAIAIGMALYTFEAFSVFRLPFGSPRKGIYLRQRLLTFLMVGICFCDLYLVSEDVKYLLFYLFFLLFFLLMAGMTQTIYDKMDVLLLNNMTLLLGIGFCMLSRLSFSRAIRQYMMALVGLLVSLIIPYLLKRFPVWKKLTWMYGMAGLLLLSLVLMFGESTLGAKISFQIGPISFQPSEFVKILFVFFLAGALWQNTGFIRVAICTALAGGHVIMLVLSRDLGSALIFFVVFLCMIFVATHNYWYLLIGTIGGGAAAWLAYRIFDHVKVRMMAWRDPWHYIDDQGYQITQSLFAISNGGLFGSGLLQGNPSAIPYVEEDFIFSALCEELGLVTGICLILICLSCFLFFMQLAMGAKDGCIKLAAYGLGIIYIFQIFLTIGGGTKFIPLTGLTLPFLSYGGSSLIATFILFYAADGMFLTLLRQPTHAKPKGVNQHAPKQSTNPRTPKSEPNPHINPNRRRTAGSTRTTASTAYARANETVEPSRITGSGRPAEPIRPVGTSRPVGSGRPAGSSRVAESSRPAGPNRTKESAESNEFNRTH